MRPVEYLNLILPVFNTTRTKEILKINPVVQPVREEAKQVEITVYEYNDAEIRKYELAEVSQCFQFSKNDGFIYWINVDGLRKADIEQISECFGIHGLITEDILSLGQRPKMDELENLLYCLLNMLYYNEKKCSVESEQISILLGKNFVISFQEDPHRDVFNSLREKLQFGNSKIRQTGADYLCYTMIDLIVDHYFFVMEKLGDKIEEIEEQIIRSSNKRSLAKINNLRKEIIVLKRNISPVREIISGIIRSENELLQERTNKYFKDVYDHILQANDLAENYRDITMNLQDLYISNVNLKLNEVMKVIAIVTCLLAPATVIGGIFGMNFDVIPGAHHQLGFYFAVGCMLFIPLLMLWIFKRRGWF